MLKYTYERIKVTEIRHLIRQIENKTRLQCPLCDLVSTYLSTNGERFLVKTKLGIICKYCVGTLEQEDAEFGLGLGVERSDTC